MLTILGAERFVEMKRNLIIESDIDKNGEFPIMSFQNVPGVIKQVNMTYRQALTIKYLQPWQIVQ